MIASDINVVLPEIVLAVYAMIALLAAVYTTKDKLGGLLVWLTAAVMVAVRVIGVTPSFSYSEPVMVIPPVAAATALAV